MPNDYSYPDSSIGEKIGVTGEGSLGVVGVGGLTLGGEGGSDIMDMEPMPKNGSYGSLVSRAERVERVVVSLSNAA